MSDLNDLFKAAADAKRKLKEEQENTQSGKALKALQERLKKNNDFADQMTSFVENKPVVKEIIKEVEVVKEIVKEQSFQQPAPQPVDPNFTALIKKVQFLEQAIGRVAAAGPGSGEVNFRYLDDVNRGTMNAENDNWVLEYDATTKKAQFTEHVGPIRSLKLNTAGPQTALVPGQLAWNVEEDCLDIRHADGSTLQTGFEHYFQIHNSTGTTLLNGEVVMFSGVDSESASNPIVEVNRYAAGPLATPLYLVGVMTNDVADGGHGRATAFGKVRGLDTTGSSVGETWSKGNLLWAHPTMPGKLTKVRPTAPNVATSVAAVLRVGTTDGVLLVRPTIWPRLFYGDWYDTTNQTAAAINTAYAVKMNTAGAVSGFSINAGGTEITALNAGRYNFEFSLQFTSSNSSTSRVYIWYRKNGVDVPYSNTVLTISSNGGKLAPAWNFPVLMEINDTFTLMWATDSTSVSLSAENSLSFCPSVPSVILTVSQTNL